MKLHVDQASHQLRILFTDQKIQAMLDDWKARHNDGEDPPIGSEPSHHQISALHARLIHGGRPYADFEI